MLNTSQLWLSVTQQEFIMHILWDRCSRVKSLLSRIYQACNMASETSGMPGNSSLAEFSPPSHFLALFLP